MMAENVIITDIALALIKVNFISIDISKKNLEKPIWSIGARF